MLQLKQRAYRPVELGEIFGVSYKTVLNEMERGSLRHVKLPSGRVCYPEHILEYLEAAEAKAAATVKKKLAAKAAKSSG